jgi:hypothetical protein
LQARPAKSSELHDDSSMKSRGQNGGMATG